MGIISSNLNVINSIDKTKKTLNDLTNYLLSQHMDQILDKSFCKKTKIFVKDKILMNLSQTELNNLSNGNELYIGKEMDNLDKKNKLCEHLANFYLKKLNLLVSIRYIIDYSINYSRMIEKGPRCFKKMKKQVSEIKYTSNFNKSNNIKWIDDSTIKLPVKDAIQINDLNIKEIAYQKYLKKLLEIKQHNNLNGDIEKNFIISELSEHLCKEVGGEYIKDIKKLVELNIIPDPNLKEYNKNFKKTIDNLNIFLDKNIKYLLSNLNKVIEEKQENRKINGIDNKVLIYLEKEIKMEQLDSIISSTKEIIKNILIELNYVLFLVTNYKFITINEIENKKHLENKQKELNNLLALSEKDILSSN